jgi:GntR family transcriptional regulator, transcriptional repressor for pyruvate dehydrogenase complex
MSIEFEALMIEPAYRKVASALLGRITDRTLSAGNRLPSETELARQFGVNRSTVREALRELESSGVLRRSPGSKLMMVTRPGRRMVADGVCRALALHDVSVRDVWEGLTLLEPSIAETAARRRSTDDIANLDAAAAEFAAGSIERTEAAAKVGRFFRAVGEATHNRVLMLAHEPLIQLLEPSLCEMIDRVPQARTRIVAAQKGLAEAIASRDHASANNWMAKHIRDFKRGYELAGIDLSHLVGLALPEE